MEMNHQLYLADPMLCVTFETTNVEEAYTLFDQPLEFFTYAHNFQHCEFYIPAEALKSNPYLRGQFAVLDGQTIGSPFGKMRVELHEDTGVMLYPEKSNDE